MDKKIYVCNASFGRDALTVRDNGKEVIFRTGHRREDSGNDGLDVWLDKNDVRALIEQLEETLEVKREQYDVALPSEYDDGEVLRILHSPTGILPELYVSDGDEDSRSIYLSENSLITLKGLIERSLDKIARNERD